MRVFSIDPGYGRSGFAVLDSGVKKHTYIFSECFETSQNEEFELRLHNTGTRFRELIKEYTPDCVAIEGLFFAKNKKTALNIAEIRGCFIFIAKEYNLPIYEYTPNQIKSALTGNGSASKGEVLRMLKHFISKPLECVNRDDEIDAIALGVTHLSNVLLKHT